MTEAEIMKDLIRLEIKKDIKMADK